MGNNPTPPAPGKGRPKGSPNRATANARQAIGEFVEGNVGRLNGLLDTIEKEQGAKAAWDCIVDVLEYHVPKLSRIDQQALDRNGNPTDPPGIEVTFVQNKNSDT